MKGSKTLSHEEGIVATLAIRSLVKYWGGKGRSIIDQEEDP